MYVQCQKRALDPLKLEMILSHHVGAGYWTLGLCKSNKCCYLLSRISSLSFFFFFEWCSKSPLNPFRDEDTQTLTWKLACHIRFLREPVLREEAFRLAPDHFLLVLCSRVWYIYQCGLTFLFWEESRDNNNSLYCFWSLLTPLGQQLKGKFCMPGICIFVI